MTFTLPDDSQHVAVVGRNGSGKTQAAVWQLSLRSITSRPWLVIDFKRDQLIQRLVRMRLAEQLKVGEKVPKRPGVYVVSPTPLQQDELELMMWRLWEKGKTGLYIDEGYMIDRNSPAFNAILTQGRSKNIPVIVLSQRPVYMSRFVFSEAAHFHVFHLNDQRDRKTITGFAPINFDKLGLDYSSQWYDVKQGQVYDLRPVPDAATIVETFKRRLNRKATL